MDDDAFMRTAEEVDPDMPRDQAAEEDPPRDVPEGFTPCSNDLLLAWKEGAEINSLARKPHKGFDQAMSEACCQARDARRKCRNAEAQRNRRGGGRTAGKDATDAAGNDSPHDANPEYRVAAG
eukprot:jgi/Tetstr1/429593/TSEL_019492.t1